MMKIIPLRPDELWGCLPCSKQDRDARAVVVAEMGTPGLTGSTRTGLCGNHAEVMTEADLRAASRRFVPEGKEDNDGNQ